MQIRRGGTAPLLPGQMVQKQEGGLQFCAEKETSPPRQEQPYAGAQFQGTVQDFSTPVSLKGIFTQYTICTAVYCSQSIKHADD